MSREILFRRSANLITDAAWTLWFGGLTFYMSVVVPIGGEVVGSDVQGEITAVVTGYLNIASFVAAGLMLVRGLVCKRKAMLWGAVMIAITAIALVVLRQVMLDRMNSIDQDADGAAKTIQWLKDWSFYSLHRIYLWVTTIQWLSGVLVLWSQAGNHQSTSNQSPASS